MYSNAPSTMENVQHKSCIQGQEADDVRDKMVVLRRPPFDPSITLASIVSTMYDAQRGNSQREES